MLLGVRRGAPLEVHPFEKVGLLRRSGSVKCPLSCAHPTGARRSHDRFFATFHSFIPLLLLSGKLQNGRKIHPENQIMMVGFAAQGAGQETNGLAQSALVQRRRVPLSCGRKIGISSSFFPYKPQGACLSRANVSRLGVTAPLEAIPIGRDKAKSRWFSKSKSVCAGGSGKVPRLCAI